MSDASTTQSVECPICGEEFDPTVAGGWCTNTECGEWQYTEATGEEQDAEDNDGFGSTDETDEQDDEFVSADEMDDADEDGTSAVFAADEEADADETVAATLDADETDAKADAAEVEPETDDAADVDVDAAEADAEAESETGDTAEAESETDDTAEAESETDDTAEAEVDAAEAEPETGEDDAADAETDSIDCPDCGTELDADANFCLECGADVSDVSPDEPLTACPSCDADVDPDANFCPSCGEDLAAHREDRTAEAEEASTDALDALESEDEPVPESLVLAVEGREIPIEDGEKVGREIRAALMDAGRPEEEAVRIHREHVRFVRESDGFYLLDLGDNPTSLNGRTLTKGDREPVTPGDELELSGVADVEIRAA